MSYPSIYITNTWGGRDGRKYKLNNMVADLDNVLQRNLFLSNGLRQDQLNAYKNKKPASKEKNMWSKLI